MKKTLFAISMFASVAIFAQGEEAKWLRQNALSPDGSKIAFSYKGDIYMVSSDGGDATRLTTNAAYETYPIWSADGGSIAFSSTREGSADIFVMPANGGRPKRLTTHPGSEMPLAFDNNGNVLFAAYISCNNTYSDLQQDPEMWRVSVQGGRPVKVSDITMSAISVNSQGVMLYEDYKGYEDQLRKHHTSSVTHDIWSYEPASGDTRVTKNGKFTKLSSFKGENRNPQFAADGDTYYYLSEENGTFNVWKSSLSAPTQKQPMTSFKTHPVRYLSVASNGLISFSYNGELYTMREGLQPQKLSIKVSADNGRRDVEKRNISSGASYIALSPNEKEIAFIVHGDVYVTSVEYGTTKRITNTAEQERSLCFTPDGRSIVYASERNGMWNIYKTELADEDERYFTYALTLKETQLTNESSPCFYPQVSPDGKKLAYLKDRTTIVVADIDGKNAKTVLDGKWNYSYSDGDQEFTWSPDSRYIIANYIGVGGWHHVDGALIDVKSGELTDLTESGYSDANFKWVLGGKAMAWQSDRNGYRSHGSWGSEDDVYLMFFDDEAYNAFRLTEEEDLLKKELERDKKKEKKEAKEKEKKEEKEAEGKFEPEDVEPLHLELSGRHDRTVRLTKSSGHMGDFYLSKDGTKMFYTTRLEKGSDLCVANLRDGSIRVLCKDVSGNIVPNKDGSKLFIASYSGISSIDAESGAKKSISYTSEFEYKPAKEREYIFDHAWQQVKDKFYDPQLHNVDWDMMKQNYRKFLPYIDNNYDFRELLSELLGELNGSHTGARYRPRAAHNIAHLGVLFDESYAGDGLKIAEVLPQSPLATLDPKVSAGDVITSIDGVDIKAGADWFELLIDKSHKVVALGISPAKGKARVVRIHTLSGSDESTMIYKRWVRRNEETVARLSGGKIAYVHVQGMNSPSFREVYSKLLGKYRNCDAVIVDTRHNGGGWLHDDLATLLSGETYVKFMPRGQYISDEPFSKWNKPSCVLVSEDNYSDAHGFPYTYQSLKIGKIIGTPVPGTMTAVWWETQIDESLVFGIPQVGSYGVKDNRFIENLELQPDILVYNDPADVLAGRDAQLEAAVAEMLKTTK